MVQDKRILLCGSLMAVVLGLSPAFAAPAKKAAAPAPKTTAVKQVVTGPVERYWVSAATTTGMTMGGGKPSMGSMMNMMTGGGDNVGHSLNLRLGSSQAAAGEPSALHIPSAGLKAKELPLFWQAPTSTGPSTPVEDDREDKTYEPPKGKILIFWGCGEHAPANQPIVIDLSKITDPNARMSEFKKFSTGVTLDNATGPQPGNGKTYGEWPNPKFKPKDIKGDTSLVGAHSIKSNYGPQIDFTLDATQDFMPAVDVTGNAATASGANILTWSPIAGAKGIVATAIGGGQDTMVMWTSAAMQTGWFISPDYLTPNDITRLLNNKALLPGEATTCTVPAEAMKAMNAGIYGLTAYGQEVNMAYPPRPEDPKVAWNIQWETKVRYRTSTGGMLGQDLGGMAAGNSDASQQGGDKPKKKKRSIMGEVIKQGVGSFIP